MYHFTFEADLHNFSHAWRTDSPVGDIHLSIRMPPSATYQFPSGPNFNPRGLLKPLAITLLVVSHSKTFPSSSSYLSRHNYFLFFLLLVFLV